MANSKDRINTAGGNNLGQNPFGNLDNNGLPDAAPAAVGVGAAQATRPQGDKPPPRVRMEVRREKGGRGGKTVTLVRPLTTVDTRQLEDLADTLKRRLATGGRVESGKVEIQGDHVPVIVQLLVNHGWQAFAGN